MSTLPFSRYKPVASIFPPVYVTYSPSKKLWVMADEIFHDMMILEGIPRWKAEAAYRAVRLFARRW